MKYYIYDLYKNRYVKEFENMDEMIQFLGRNTYLNQDWWSNRSESATKLNQKYKNAYLDEINMNFNDMYLGGICGEYYTRRYMFIDDNWKIYDMRVYWEEIKKEYCRVCINNEGNLEVTIENKMEHKDEDKKEHYLRREFSYSNYQQVYVLPEDVEKDHVTAAVENGVLAITMPKKTKEEEKKALRQIEIG